MELQEHLTNLNDLADETIHQIARLLIEPFDEMPTSCSYMSLYKFVVAYPRVARYYQSHKKEYKWMLTEHVTFYNSEVHIRCHNIRMYRGKFHNYKQPNGVETAITDVSDNTVDVYSKIWYKHGRYHRLGNPAIETQDALPTKLSILCKPCKSQSHFAVSMTLEVSEGAIEENYNHIWCKDGIAHREDGPAIEYRNHGYYSLTVINGEWILPPHYEQMYMVAPEKMSIRYYNKYTDGLVDINWDIRGMLLTMASELMKYHITAWVDDGFEW